MTDEELVKQLRDEALDLHRSAWRDISGGQNATISATLADTTADRIEQLTAERDRLRRALHYYADFHSAPSDGPWGVNSDDFGAEARAALKGETP